MATNPFDPGQISVPMSTILDALEDVLSDAERTALFNQLIGLRPAGVAPGDLITAELFNQVLSDINSLTIRVALLESASNTTPKKPVIKQIVPQMVHSGDQLLVLGENLNPSLLSRIEVENSTVPIASLKTGSGPTQLIFDAPAVIGLPTNGATVILKIDNPAGSAQGTYVQLPGISAQITANVSFLFKSFTPDQNLAQGVEYALAYELNIHSSHDETFKLVPHITGTGWSASVQTSDQIPATAASAQAGLVVQKVIKVIAGTGPAAQLTLELKGTGFPGFTQSSQAYPLALGAKPASQSNQILFISTNVPGPHEFANNVIKVFNKGPVTANGSVVTLNVTTLFGALVNNQPTQYSITGLQATPASDWQVTSSPTTPFTISQASFPQVMSFIITPKKKSADNTTFISADGKIEFTIAGPNGATQKFTADLKVLGA